jgi:hypothetical protein
MQKIFTLIERRHKELYLLIAILHYFSVLHTWIIGSQQGTLPGKQEFLACFKLLDTGVHSTGYP